MTAKPDPLADIKATFFVECEELLEELADGLESMRKGTATQDSLNSVFRAVHSIKGGAAAFSLNDLTDFAHGLEAQLVSLRDRGSIPDIHEIPPLERAADRLASLVELAASGKIPNEEDRLLDAALLAEVSETNLSEWHLKVKAGQNTRLLFANLATLGQISAIPDLNSLPSLSSIDPATPKLSWKVQLKTELPLPLLRKAVSEFDVDDRLTLIVGDDIVNTAPQSVVEPGVLEAATQNPTIRVGLERIDRLINLVGELVINQAMLARSAEEIGTQSNSDHALGLDELMRLTRDIQDSVMQIRAQPIKPLFQRMARITREAAEQTGKSVELVCEGQETEIDKTVIERLAEPLTHMIRNAVDHGIDKESERVAAGKPAAGQITLRAFHRSGQVILEIKDDGNGIDRDQVLEIAIDRQLISPDADLSLSEIDQLLFAPGFSTAPNVSPLSGRGVGMDVVRTAIHNLGGRIAIESTPGVGTRFEIALPLTLAVLDAMVVSAAGQTLVLPLSNIHETLTIQDKDLLTLRPGERMLRYGGTAIALIDLAARLGYQAPQTTYDGQVALLIAAEGQPKVALAIDEIHEQRQVVIKGLQEGFQTASSVAAATILGDGRVALIIDPLDPSLLPNAHNVHTHAVVPLEISGR